MALSADQRAMLELMLQRGQGYADLASLLDVSEAEVRARARGALTELGGADPDRNVGLTDWILGQADPIGRADAARHVREDPSDRDLASNLITQLRVLAPEADLPKLPGEPARGRRTRRADRAEAPTPTPAEETPAAPAPAEPRRRRLPSGPSLDSHRARLIAALAAGAVILIAVVLAVTGAFDSDESAGGESGDGTATSPGQEQTLAAIPMRAPEGGEGEGTAVIGQTSTDNVFLELNIQGVPPPGRGEGYLLWLLLTENEGTVIPTPIPVDRDGNFQDRLSLPATTFQIVARTRFLDLALIDQTDLQRITDQVNQERVIFPFVGQTALRGEVPMAGGTGAGADESQGG